MTLYATVLWLYAVMASLVLGASRIAEFRLAIVFRAAVLLSFV
jgi:hypothetical protein